jgi:hypothetical protein
MSKDNLTLEQRVAVGQEVTRAVLEFAKGVESVMTPLECARQFMAAAAVLAGTVAGRAGAISLSRGLLDALENPPQPEGPAN